MFCPMVSDVADSKFLIKKKIYFYIHIETFKFLQIHIDNYNMYNLQFIPIIQFTNN